MPLAGKVMLIVFWDSQAVLLTHFQKRGESMNSALYCEVFLKLWDAIHRRRPGQLEREVLLDHDNAGPHIARATQKRIRKLQWELLEHQPYSLDLDSSDFHLPGSLKERFDGRRFADVEVEMQMQNWLKQQSKDFYAACLNALVKRWGKCIDVDGGYVEK
jgi:hypothetical protein